MEAALAASAGIRTYSAEEIASATGNFSELAVIGEGGFGRVFRGMLSTTPVAIKVMDEGGLQGQAEFANELALLSRLRHPNLVRLLGCCRGGGGGSGGGAGASALVYELMPGGSSDAHLAYRAGRPPLPWCCRIRAAAQAGAALAYLHAQDPPVIHRDVKPANIFLDATYNAKLGDVGLAAPAHEGALATARKDGGGGGGIAGEWAYLAPEYRSDGRLSLRTDGVTLLQLATGATDGLASLVSRCREAAASGRPRELLDPSAGPWDAFAGERLVALGLWCCCDAPDGRPMVSVAAAELARLAAAVRSAPAAGACGACCPRPGAPAAGVLPGQAAAGGGTGGLAARPAAAAQQQPQPQGPQQQQGPAPPSPRRQPAAAPAGTGASPRQQGAAAVGALFGAPPGGQANGGAGAGGGAPGFWRPLG